MNTSASTHNTITNTRVSCPFSGITYSISTSVPVLTTNAPVFSVHPLINAHLSQVLSYASTPLKTFALLYSLRSFSLMEYTYCKAFAGTDVSDDVLETLCHEVNTRLQRCVTKIINLTQKERALLPRIRLHKSTLVQVRNYCDALEVALSTQDAAEQFLATTTPGQRRAHIAQKISHTSAIITHLKWAEETLITRTTDFNVTISANMRAAVEGKSNIVVMKKVRDYLMDNLPETRVEDSIRKDAIIYAIDTRIGEKVASFGQGGLLSAEERESARAVISRYSVLDEVPSNIQALEAMTSATLTKEPVRSDYANNLDYLVAKMAYKAALDV